MTKEFKYLKEGLTTDLAEFLISDYNLDFKEALDILYGSDTYAKISDPATGLYYQGSKYLYSYLQNEIETGVLA